MGGTSGTILNKYSPELAERLHAFVARAAAQPDVPAAVEANHDDNRWWPSYVQDWRGAPALAPPGFRGFFPPVSPPPRPRPPAGHPARGQSPPSPVPAPPP